ncbi:serine/threonine protein kinase [Nitzschia inconspicua]|uniref:Serine/threonine protein kinase n=1 Tax=Nitzschia inconspicua TaxID=303405 RepID=A0A9K3KDI2_9STRA|nr:serine/threonine protein kinase [Nitzschia inconspicua]
MSGDKKIGEFTEAHLLKVSEDCVAKKTKDSTILDVKAEERIPKFDLKELQIGKVLGRGGFCVVKEVTKITLSQENGGAKNDMQHSKTDDEHYIANIVQDRGFMAQHCIRQGKDYRYAIKLVQESSRNDPHVFINAVVDLAVESRFLSVVRHPNIIKMRAMDSKGPFQPHFFVVLDRLYDIMPVRINKWKKQAKGGLRAMLKSKKAKEALFVERLTVAYDIACALSYLHGLNVIYRDLKPDNVGFDVRGDVKIFDFGLAKELDESKKLQDGTYHLTADTGSLRYMAPEVFLGKPYNETADTFSFCILFWQILAMETPYEGFTVKMFEKSVITGGARPKINQDWGKTIVTLLGQGYVDNPKRPAMNEVCEQLREEINNLSDDEIVDIVDASRKSQLSAH